MRVCCCISASSGFSKKLQFSDRLYYISAFSVLEETGLSGVLDLLRREIQARGASVLVLDGLSAIEDASPSVPELKKFIHQLQAHAMMASCTTLLLTGTNSVSAEHTLADGVIELQTRLYGKRAERSLQVHKLRGSGYLRGEHSYRITDEGITVYPRTEGVWLRTALGRR